MATITTYPGTADLLPLTQSFDITSIVAKRVGPYLNYYSFNTDGTMFVIHTQGVAQPDGTLAPMIVGWDQYNGSDLVQSATMMLDVQPFLTNLYGRNPSSTRAVAYLTGGGDLVTGSDGRDVLYGYNGNDTLTGGNGADRLLGGAGHDILQGGAGRDNLAGQAGDDRLDGGTAADRLTGGAGADTFVFHAPAEGGDTITDFAPGLDHIALDATGFGLAGPLTEGANFVAGAGATAVAAVATLAYDTATGQLWFDADGTGAAAATLLATLTGQPALTAADFQLI